MARLAVLLGLLAFVAVGASASLDDNVLLELFKAWKQQFAKVYDSAEEELHRYTVFVENMLMIVEHNESGASWTMAMNEYGDLTWSEFKDSKLSKMPFRKTNRGSKPNALFGLTTPPDSIDWVAKGKVNPIQNQGQCGSCWAFSAVASFESAIAIQTGKLEKLSEQQLVDCAGSYGCHGCHGGLMDYAFEYIESNGLCSEKAYGYTAKQAWRCHATKSWFSSGCKAAAFVGKFVDVPSMSEVSLKAAVAQQPVSVAIEADHPSFQFYNGGVYNGQCGTQLDHGVVVVGYGTDETSGQKFWKIRNSWGATWGEAGYIRVERTDSSSGAGICGLCESPSFPRSCSDAAVKCAA